MARKDMKYKIFHYREECWNSKVLYENGSHVQIDVDNFYRMLRAMGEKEIKYRKLFGLLMCLSCQRGDRP